MVDGLLVSARAWPDNPAWMRAFLEVLRAHAARRTPAGGRRRTPGLAFRLQPSLPSWATWSSVRPISAASTFSSRWATLEVPGIGSITGERCSSQARASCAGVAPSLSLRAVSGPSRRARSPVASGNQGMNPMRSRSQ